jgi:hypothetical protein
MSTNIAASLDGRTFVPTLNYGRINRAVPRTASNAVQPGYVPPRETIQVFAPPPDTIAADIGAIVCRLLLGAQLGAVNALQRVSWILTAFECLFPGFANHVMGERRAGRDTSGPSRDGLYRIVVNTMTEAFVRYWSAGEYRVVLPAIPAQPAVPATATSAEVPATDARPETTTWEFYGSTDEAAADLSQQIDFLPGILFTDLPDDISDADACAVLGLLLFSIIKTPNEVNEVAFTMRRPRAAAGAIGRASNEPFPESLRPPLHMYTFVGSLFTAFRALRIEVCLELAKWAKAERIGPRQGFLIAQVRLWRGHGLTGLLLVSKLVTNYGAVLSRVSGYRRALEAYNEHLNAYIAKENEPLRDYWNAIYGDISDMSARMDYSELVLLAGDYEALRTGSFGNFGRNEMDLRFEDEMHTVADGLGVVLPQRRPRTRTDITHPE